MHFKLNVFLHLFTCTHPILFTLIRRLVGGPHQDLLEEKTDENKKTFFLFFCNWLLQFQPSYFYYLNFLKEFFCCFFLRYGETFAFSYVRVSDYCVVGPPRKSDLLPTVLDMRIPPSVRSITFKWTHERMLILEFLFTPHLLVRCNME